MAIETPVPTNRDHRRRWLRAGIAAPPAPKRAKQTQLSAFLAQKQRFDRGNKPNRTQTEPGWRPQAAGPRGASAVRSARPQCAKQTQFRGGRAPMAFGMPARASTCRMPAANRAKQTQFPRFCPRNADREEEQSQSKPVSAAESSAAGDDRPVGVMACEQD